MKVIANFNTRELLIENRIKAVMSENLVDTILFEFSDDFIGYEIIVAFVDDKKNPIGGRLLTTSHTQGALYTYIIPSGITAYPSVYYQIIAVIESTGEVWKSKIDKIYFFESLDRTNESIESYPLYPEWVDAINQANEISGNISTQLDTIIQLEEDITLAESLRDSAEDIRIANENGRISNEATRSSTESTRILNENGRISNEATRTSSEATRVGNENVRIANENRRISNEATRTTSEITRVQNESGRISNEATRTTNENTRISQENGRVSNESTRVTKENGRIANEATRLSNENIRISNEDGRITNESLRVLEEESRVTEEGLRVLAEQNRVDAEASRVLVENNRVSAELNRVNQESSRVIAENGRVSNEATRNSQEQLRISNESLRITRENGRIANEATRISNENIRISGENQRISNEALRVSVENNRVFAEQSRVSAENVRIQAEFDRASAEVERSVWETYNPSESYKIGNKVYYNGSSYICIADATGIVPTNTSYWSIVVQRGDQGVQGIQGIQGYSGTITIGNVNTVYPNSPATVENLGTPENAIFDFDIPRGSHVQIGTVTATQYSTNTPSITDSGTNGDSVLNFKLPRAATVSIGSVNPTTYSTDLPDVDNVGANGDMVLNFLIPRAPSVSVGSTSTGSPGTNALVNNNGSNGDVVLDFTIPRGDKGETGANFTILGIYDSLSALISNHATGSAGDAWAVGTNASKYIYIWDTNITNWASIGSISTSLSAQDVFVADTLDFFSGTNVETVLAEIHNDVITRYPTSQVSSSDIVNTAVLRDGNKAFQISGINFTTSDTNNPTPKKMSWNTNKGTFDAQLYNGVTLQLGQEIHSYGIANTSITDGQVVMFAGSVSDKLKFDPANSASPGFTPERIVGLATHSASIGNNVYVTWFGEVNGINTATLPIGTVLYSDPAVVGGLTSTKPTPPIPAVKVGVVTRSAVDGTIFCYPDWGEQLSTLYDVSLNSLSNGDLIAYNQSNSRWENRKITYSEVGAEPANSNIQSHISNTSNPHSVTYSQVGAAPTVHTHSQYQLANEAITINNIAYQTVNSVVNIGGDAVILDIYDELSWVMKRSDTEANTLVFMPSFNIQQHYWDDQKAIKFYGSNGKIVANNFATPLGSASEFLKANGTVDSTAYAPLASPTFTGTVSGITASMVGLGNVTNESKTTMFTNPTFTGVAKSTTPSTGDNSTNIATTAFVVNALKYYSVGSTYTANTSLTLPDIGKLVLANSASAITLTLDNNNLASAPIGSQISVIRYGTGTVTFTGINGITVVAANSKYSIYNQYEVVTVIKMTSSEWLLIGSLG